MSSLSGHRLLRLLISLLVMSSCLSSMQVGSATDDGGRGPSDGGDEPAGDGRVLAAQPQIYEEIRESSGDTSFGIFSDTAGDINGDGADDFLQWRLSHSGNLYMVYGSKTRDFSSSIVGYTGPCWFLPVGDLNGDGYDDVVLCSEAGAYNPYSLEVDGLPAKLGIRYGSATGLGRSDDGTLYITPVHSNGSDWDRLTYEDLGDVNGDGYCDIMVIASTGTVISPYNRLRSPIELQIYFGSADGLAAAPGWTADLTADDANWTAMMVVGHGDFNGDGRSDVIFNFGSGLNGSNDIYLYARALAVHFGSEGGLSLDPDFQLEFPASGTSALEAVPVRFDDDAVDDLMVVTTEVTDLWGNNSVDLFVFSGSRTGLEDDTSFTLALENLDFMGYWVLCLDQPWALPARFLDINGDGRDDMVGWTIDYLKQSREPGLEDWQYIPHMNFNLSIHLNGADGLLAEPDAEYSMWNVSPSNDMFSSVGVGDFDGDGMEDLALATGGLVIGIPPFRGQMLAWPGPLFQFYGSGLTSLASPILPEAPSRYYAAYKSYEFLVLDDPKGMGASIDVVLTLDPGRVGARLRMHRDGASPTWSVMDGSDVVSLTSTPSDLFEDENRKATWLRFRVLFDWDWPHEEACDVGVDYSDSSGHTYGYMMPNVFRVENDLDLAGELAVNGSYQGPLVPGQWVRGGETLDLSGPVTVYQGTTDIHPPAGSCNVSLLDDDGDRATAPSPGDAPVSMSITADAETDTSETLTLGLVDLPRLAEAGPPMTFALRVDADPPRFEGQMPDSDDWLSTGDVLVAIMANDTGTSGVAEETLEYSYCGAGGVVDWGQRGLAMGWVQGLVEASTVLSLPDGADFWVQWRVKDRVGNGWTYSDRTPLRVDTINLTFSNPVPNPDGWVGSRTVQCGVTVRDVRGSGVDAVTVQYRASVRNVTAYGPWTAWDPEGVDAQVIEARVELLLAEGAYNYVQWRASDVAGNGPVVSPHYRVRVDTQPVEYGPFWPTGLQNSSEVEVGALLYKGELGSDVDASSCMYRQRYGEGRWSPWAPLVLSVVDGSTYRLTAQVTGLIEGPDNYVQFQAIDLARNGPTLSAEHRIGVDLSGPMFDVVGPDGIQAEPMVLVSVRVSDALAGVDTATVAFRCRTMTSDDFGAWSTLELIANGTAFEGTVRLMLEPGDRNAIQLTGRDLVGNVATSDPLWIWVNRPPEAVIMRPLTGANRSADEPMFLSAEGSGDPDGQNLSYSWYLDGELVSDDEEGILPGPFPTGPHRVELVVTDPLGARDNTSSEVGMLEAVPPTPPRTTSLTEWALPLIVIILVVVGTAIYLRRAVKRL